MEDAATAEISRSQVWQCIHHGVKLPDGREITRELVSTLLDEEMDGIHASVGDEVWAAGRPQQTRAIFETVALSDELAEFLTLEAYPVLIGSEVNA
jgi:malate synthase